MKRLFLCLVLLMAGMNLQAQNSNVSETIQYFKDGNVTALKKEAQTGNALAMNYLSKLYEEGRGVAKNQGEAFYWLKKAAEADDEYISKVAAWYYNGKGGAPNLTEAFRWWKKGAETGSLSDIYNLAYCYYLGEGTTKSIADAMYWWMSFAMRMEINELSDDEDDIFDLLEFDEDLQDVRWKIAECFWKGDGVEHSYKEAVKWWKKAASDGHEPSQKALKACNETW